MKEQIVRTVAPLLVGWMLAAWTFLGDWAESAVGVVIPAMPEDPVMALATVVVAGLYYVAVALLEKYVKPWFGWLLGLAREVSYTKPAKAKVVASRERPPI